MIIIKIKDGEPLDLDEIRKKFIKYTRKGFQLIPKIENPKILDVGCGTGVPTIELAKISGGEIIAMDINAKELKILDKKIIKQKLNNQIKTINRSLFNNNFKDQSFDIIWAEGVFHIIGFKEGFEACHRILKDKGFLVLNSEIKKIKDHLKNLDSLDYKLYDCYKLPDEIWWDEFYEPLERHIRNIVNRNPNLKSNKQIRRFQDEIAMVKSNPKDFDTAFYILQKV
ncbi:MAG: methyltransferase domain-containing protein [Promethearchaeati archaeon]